MIDDWNDLRYFLAVARHGQLSSAARALGVDHSTVFRKLKKIEETLGTRIFERRKERYVLTGPGEAMLAHATRIEQEVDGLNLTLTGKDIRLEGRIRVTTTHSTASMLIAPYLSTFLEDYPKIQLSFSITAREFDLSRYQADVALRATNKPPEHLIGRKLMNYRWVLFATHDYLNKHELPTTPEDLSKHQILTPGEEMAGIRMMRKLLAILPKTRENAVSANELQFIFNAVRAGLGLGLLPTYFAKQAPELVHVPMPQAESESQMWFLAHPEQAGLARIRALGQFFAETFASF